MSRENFPVVVEVWTQPNTMYRKFRMNLLDSRQTRVFREQLQNTVHAGQKMVIYPLDVSKRN